MSKRELDDEDMFFEDVTPVVKKQKGLKKKGKSRLSEGKSKTTATKTKTKGRGKTKTKREGAGRSGEEERGGGRKGKKRRGGGGGGGGGGVRGKDGEDGEELDGAGRIPGAGLTEEQQFARVEAMQAEFEAKVEEYQGGSLPEEVVKGVWHKREREVLKRDEKSRKQAAEATAAAEMMLLTQTAGYVEPENEMEKLSRIPQAELAEAVDASSAAKRFDLALEYGPYSLDYSRNGKYLVLGGRKGHLALMEWKKAKLEFEIVVKETIFDVKVLHSHMFLGCAQKSALFIYDHTGMELHCLRDHPGARKIDFLPYHFLLTSLSTRGTLRYVDISMGTTMGVKETRRGNGGARSLSFNPHNAVVGVGHSTGVVSMWAPNSSLPVAKVLATSGPVNDLAFSSDGHYMVTGGQDRTIRVWDVRKFEELHAYKVAHPVSSIEVSQRGVIAAGYGTYVQTWKDGLATMAKGYYLRHHSRGSPIWDSKFAPYEDVLGLGTESGISSILVPGSGEPNFDSYVANPYETAKQRQETTVKQLLDKIPADMIALDNSVLGSIDPDADKNAIDELKARFEATHGKGTWKPKNKQKGRNKTGRKLNRQAKTRGLIKQSKFTEFMEAKAAAKAEIDAAIGTDSKTTKSKSAKGGKGKKGGKKSADVVVGDKKPKNMFARFGKKR